MAYLLLWSSIDRYVSLRRDFGSDDVTKRVERLAEEPVLREVLNIYKCVLDRTLRS
jgi:hypothetical protein